MKFFGDHRYYRTSGCGQYRIAKVTVCGKTQYEVWRKQVAGWMQLRTGLTTARAAEMIAEVDEATWKAQTKTA